MPISLPTVQKVFHLLSHPGPMLVTDSLPSLVDSLKLSQLELVIKLTSVTPSVMCFCFLTAPD